MKFELCFNVVSPVYEKDGTFLSRRVSSHKEMVSGRDLSDATVKVGRKYLKDGNYNMSLTSAKQYDENTRKWEYVSMQDNPSERGYLDYP